MDLIIGKVTEAETGKPIRGVEVFWTSNSDDIFRTDKFGVYRIPNRAGNNTLIFKGTGKKEFRFTPSDSVQHLEYDVVLQKEDPKSITATRWEQPADEFPASIVIIERDEIEAMGYISVQELLENVSGMYIMDFRTEFGASMGIRGFWSPMNKNVMIQVNGVSMLSDQRNEFNLNDINLSVQSINRVEIVRGPMSVSYGFGAFFGVINIITENLEEGIHANLSTAVGNPMALQTSVNYSLNKNGVVISLNANHSQRSGFSEYWNQMTSDSEYQDALNDPWQNVGNNIHIGDYKDQKINVDRYSRSHQGFNTSVKYKGLFANINFARSDIGFSSWYPGPTHRNGQVSTYSVQQLGYKSSSKRKVIIEAKIDHSSGIKRPEYRILNPDGYEFSTIENASLKGELNTRILLNKKGSEAKTDLLLGGFYHFNYQNFTRFQLSEFSYTDRFFGLEKGGSARNSAAFAQVNSMVKGFNIIAGLRILMQEPYKVIHSQNQSLNAIDSSYNDTIYHTFERYQFAPRRIRFIPQAAVSYTFGKNKEELKHVLKVSFSEALNSTSVFENALHMNAFDYEENLNGTTIEDIIPQSVVAFELGYSYLNEKKRFRGTFNLFQNKINYLILNSSSDPSLARFGSGVFSTGVEVQLHGEQSWEIKNKKFIVMADISQTLQKTVGDTTEDFNQSISYSPHAQTNVKIRLRYANFTFGISTFLIGQMSAIEHVKHYFQDGTSEIITTQKQGSPINAPLSINLRYENLKVHENHLGLYFNLKIANALNSELRYPFHVSNSWADKGMLGRGRQILFTVGYKL